MTIRNADAADAEAIAQLHASSWRTAYRGILRDEFLDGPLLEDRRALWRARLAGEQRTDQIVLVAVENGRMQGFACVFLDADAEWGSLLDNLHVVAELKGKGLGRQLIAAVADLIQMYGLCKRLHLWAYEQNLSARRFYERLGGAVNLTHAEPALDGTEVNAVRYCWSELAALAAHGRS